MTTWLFETTRRNSEQKQKNHKDGLRLVEIDNYYGAHKNYKTDFRNKKYRYVYAQLIHRKPSQPEHRSLYYQDVLISIIKTLELSLMGKDNHIDTAEPYFYFGNKSINEYYWLFLREKRVIDRELIIDPEMKNRISNFLTLIVDFSAKMAQFLSLNGDSANAHNIYKACYEGIVLHVINSSTSNVLLLKKCSQYLLQYALLNLNYNNLERADELLKNGLKAQLNQLILLRSNFNLKKNIRKFMRKYVAALKRLMNFYLTLAILQEKKGKNHQCAVLVLDAANIQELITVYSVKHKRWVCSLEESYREQRARYMEFNRICQHYFDLDSLKQIEESKAGDSKKTAVPTRSRRMTKSIQKTEKSILVLRNIENQNEINARQTTIATNKTIDTKNPGKKVQKEVRFKLAFDLQENNSKQPGKNTSKMDLLLSENSEDRLSNILKQDILQDQLGLLPENRKSIEGQKSVEKRKSHSHSLLKFLHNIQNNDIMLMGENFWKTDSDMPKRSKSNLERLSKRHQYDVKRPGRRLSYTNINYLEAKNTKKNRNLSCFLKQNFNNLKKTGRQKSNYLHKTSQSPQDYLQVNQKIRNWHQKSSKIQTDIVYKMHKLKQRRGQKSSLETCLEQEKEFEFSVEEEKKGPLLGKTPKPKDDKASKYKKLRGINLFKQFIVDNKGIFNITKVELFAENYDSEYAKNHQNTAASDKQELVQKQIERNHWQAKQNIEFFKNEIQNSNKRLMKSKHLINKNNSTEQIYSRPIYQFYESAQNESNTGQVKLFSTSIKERVLQMMNYL